MRKRLLIFIGLIIVIGLIVYYILKPTSYSITYNLEDYSIIEDYNIDKQVFFFTISIDDYEFESVVKKSYQFNHKLIKKIDYYEDDTYKCINNEITGPLCRDGDNRVSPHLISDNLKEQMDIKIENNNIKGKKYKDVTIYDDPLDTVAIWNYKGFDIINSNNKDTIKIFKKDVYDSSLIAKINEFILIPDYEQEYYFSKFYILNLESLELNEFNIDYEISFDSYILGTYDKSIYLVDKKNKVEYEIVPHKEKMRIVGNENEDGKILTDGEWVSIGLSKLSSQIYSFTNEELYSYFLENNKLHLKYLFGKHNIILSDKNVFELVYKTDDYVYYLSDGKLYSYDFENYEKLLLSKEEWNFNSKNVIFIK